ncbi:hypothetical protein [Nocardiopsis composta]|uniref:Uncharacterized protein n=1 Tax=Nocardiopsis composta TaxID=157465 RepID=A0A7W8VF07_9ACTN|nr:hypothetical protein [Nocardiopsis composta]MBB5433479.1 hypothetical protein [Nocardiopsis composta]
MRLSLLLCWLAWLPICRLPAWAPPGRHRTRTTQAAPPPPAPVPVAPATPTPAPAPVSASRAEPVRPYARWQIPHYSALCDLTLRHKARWALTYEGDQAACYVATSLIEDGITVAASTPELLDAALTEFTPSPRVRAYAIDPQAATLARRSEQRLLARMIREAAAA